MNTSNYTKPTELEDFENIILRKKNEILLLNSQVSTLDTKSLDTSIYYSILKKTTLFRENFLLKPKKILERFIHKKITLSMLTMPFLNLLTVGAFFLIFCSKNTMLFTLAFLPGLISLIYVIDFAFSFSNRKKLFSIIKNISSIHTVLDFPNMLSLKFFNKNSLITNYSLLLDSIGQLEYLSSEELKSFLLLFSDDELLIIQDLLKSNFNDNKIKSLILDDICSISEQQIKDEKERLLNNFEKNITYQEFISGYLTNSPQEDLYKYDFKAIL